MGTRCISRCSKTIKFAFLWFEISFSLKSFMMHPLVITIQSGCMSARSTQKAITDNINRPNKTPQRSKNTNSFNLNFKLFALYEESNRFSVSLFLLPYNVWCNAQLRFNWKWSDKIDDEFSLKNKLLLSYHNVWANRGRRKN